MTDVARFARSSMHQSVGGLPRCRWIACALAFVAVCSSTVTVSPSLAGASSISADRTKAAILYQQIQSIGGRVEALGQKYDLVQIKLRQLNDQIKSSKSAIVQIERSVAADNAQLRQDAIFVYITNGSAAGASPLFPHDVLKSDAINVYNQLAEGNVSTTLATLKRNKIQLTQERAILYGQDRQAVNATHAAARAFQEAKILQSTLEDALSQVQGQIATFIAQQEAAAAAQSAATLQSARPAQGFPAPPPNSRASIAISAALSMIGVPYLWGGATRSGVDCSGLVLLAYAAAGIVLPHYSGSQYAATTRVPLSDIQPGDLLFYGPNGSEHEAMYLGNGQMIEAASTGTLVHISPIRLGIGFVGLGRPRA